MFMEQNLKKCRRQGQSKSVVNAYSIMQCVCTHVREEAVSNYRSSCEIGEDVDNPISPFPQDGRFIWKTPKQLFSKILYLEGPKDEAWLAEKAKNFQKRQRIERSNAMDECEKMVIQATYGLMG